MQDGLGPDPGERRQGLRSSRLFGLPLLCAEIKCSRTRFLSDGRDAGRPGAAWASDEEMTSQRR